MTTNNNKTAVHKTIKKINDSIIMMGLSNIDYLKKNTDNNKYPNDEYFTLKSWTEKIEEGPVKKIKKDKDSDSEEKKETVKKKKMPFSLKKEVKESIENIFVTFVDEVLSIDKKTNWGDNRNDIISIILEKVPNNNISKLLIKSVDSYDVSIYCDKNFGIESELTNKLVKLFDNSLICSTVTYYMSEFLKILSVNFTNWVWFTSKSTVNMIAMNQFIMDANLLSNTKLKYLLSIVNTQKKSAKKADEKKSSSKKSKKDDEKKSSSKKSSSKKSKKDDEKKSKKDDEKKSKKDDEKKSSSKKSSAKKDDEKKLSPKKSAKKNKEDEETESELELEDEDSCMEYASDDE